MNLQFIFDKLWETYTSQNLAVQQVHDLFISEGEKVVNDHIAFRTFDDAGGEIKGTPKELLEQSSIKAGIVKIDFSEGAFEIPGCYYEFARRYPDENGSIYSGFIAKSADKIFESTNFYKK